MAFEDSTPTTTPARSRYSGEGFRQEPDFREGAATFEAAAQPATPTSTTEGESTVTVAARTPNLSYVFDDPADGEPGRDRLLVHGLWELVLATALGAAVYLLYREQAGAFSGTGLTELLLAFTMFGLVASASAVALRAGVVNLAVGPVAIGAAVFFADSGGGLLTPLLVTVGVCAAVGAVQGLATVALHVPSWAVSLAAGIGVVAWIETQSPAASTSVYSAQPHVYVWLGGFFLFSILFNVLVVVPTVRRLFGRFRPVSDPADRRGMTAALIAIAATLGSSFLAGMAGVLSSSAGGAARGDEALLLTAFATGIALVGGTSAFGRRGGIFGTILAAALFTVVGHYIEAAKLNWSGAAMASVILGLGLVVTRLVERFGRPTAPREREEEDDQTSEWLLRSHSSPATTWPSGGTYQPAATSQSATGGLWASDDAWGADGR
jgi:ribose/xylose/arabinose/galactoside ABC-type transport system permease subunit